MEDKLLKYSEKVIEYGFYALVFVVPLVFTTSTYELFEFPKMILVYLLTILIVGAFLAKSVLLGRPKLPRTPLDKPIAAFVLVNILATIFSVDKYTSIFGYYTRFNGGLLSLLAYVALYYIFVGEFAEGQEGKEVKEGRRERFVKLLLLSTVLVSIYGILQHFGIDEDYWVQDVRRRVFSTLGQPNWLAAYLVMVIPVGFVYTLSSYKKSKVLFTIYYLLITICYTAFWFTYSRSGLLGFAAAMGTFLISLGKENLQKNWRPLLLVAIAWATISVLAFSSTISEKISVVAGLVPAPVQATTRVATTSSTQPPQPSTGSTVEIRLAVWKGTLNLIKDHPLLGTGPETFAYSFLPYRPVELNQTAEWEFLYNKAHNEYLNVAACTGLLGLTSYLFLIGKFVLWNTRECLLGSASQRSNHSPHGLWHRSKANENESANGQILRAGFFAGWLGVLVSDFFGFSVVATSLLFWLFMALNVPMCQCVNVSMGKKSISPRSKNIALTAILLVTLHFALCTLRLFLADVSFNSGEGAKRFGFYEQAAQDYRSAISLNPREPRYHRELALVLAKLGIVEEAAREAEIAYSLNPKNSLTVRSLISTYVELADFAPKYQTRAEELISETIAWQPTNPQLYYEQALILLKAEKNEEAITTLQEALKLKKDYRKAQDLLEAITDQR